MPLSLIFKALFDTLYMVFISGILSGLLGIILGMYIFCLKHEQILNNIKTYNIISTIINITRSLPFIILMVFIMPFTRIITGSSIGTTAALVPLTIAAIPLMARLTESALLSVPSGLLEAAKSFGATPKQIIFYFLLPESLFSVLSGFTVVLVNLVGYSAMAGAVGGGGLGDLAIRYGYQRFDIKVMFITILILIFLVQIIQYIGEKISTYYKKG